MRKQHIALFLILVFGTMLLSACGSRYGGKTYSGSDTRQIQTFKYGTVINVGLVTIRDDQTGLGVLGGALVGGILGSFVGGGNAKILGATGGAVVGGAAGAAGEEAFNTREGQEITIRLDDGNEVVIVQERNEDFLAGDRVRIITANDGSVRVRR